MQPARRGRRTDRRRGMSIEAIGVLPAAEPARVEQVELASPMLYAPLRR
jgi:hypothetical protein